MYDVTAYALNVLARETFKEKLSVFPQEVLKALIDNASWQTEKISLIKKNAISTIRNGGCFYQHLTQTVPA